MAYIGRDTTLGSWSSDMETPNSGMAVTSFWLSIISGVAIVVTFLAFVFATSLEGVSPTAVTIQFGLVLFALLGLDSIAFLLGVIALFQRGGKKSHAVLGVGI